MSSWYAYRLMADDRIRERREEAGRRRLSRDAAIAVRPVVGPGTAPSARRGRVLVQGPDPAIGTPIVMRGGRRRWTLRLAGLAVTVSVGVAARRGTGA
jgi:hypothetical protein